MAISANNPNPALASSVELQRRLSDITKPITMNDLASHLRTRHNANTATAQQRGGRLTPRNPNAVAANAGLMPASGQPGSAIGGLTAGELFNLTRGARR